MSDTAPFEMLEGSLQHAELLVIKIIQAVRYGEVRLSIRDGLPTHEPSPRIRQTIKLDSEATVTPEPHRSGLTLKREFVRLFEQIGRLREGTIEIEVRHGLPFKLVVERRYEEML